MINRIGRIYTSMQQAEEKSEPYKMSQRNSPEYNELRKLLLDVHNDERIAEYISSKNILGSWTLYDPNPEEETNWYLGWNAKNKKVVSGSSESRNFSESKIQKIDFIYQQSVWGMGRGGHSIPFELVEGRFYADGTELLDIFPELTADKLEQCARKSLSKMGGI